jgi:hypothetical protein
MPLHELALRILIAAETGVISNWGLTGFSLRSTFCLEPPSG